MGGCDDDCPSSSSFIAVHTTSDIKPLGGGAHDPGGGGAATCLSIKSTVTEGCNVMPTSKNATRYPPTTSAGKSTTHADASDDRKDSPESVRSIKKNTCDGLVADESGEATHSTLSTAGVRPAKPNTFHDDLEPADVNPHLYPDVCPTSSNRGAAQTASEEAVAAKLVGGGGHALGAGQPLVCGAAEQHLQVLLYTTIHYCVLLHTATLLCTHTTNADESAPAPSWLLYCHILLCTLMYVYSYYSMRQPTNLRERFLDPYADVC